MNTAEWSTTWKQYKAQNHQNKQFDLASFVICLKKKICLDVLKLILLLLYVDYELLTKVELTQFRCS